MLFQSNKKVQLKEAIKYYKPQISYDQQLNIN